MTTRTPQPSPRNPDPSICVALVHNNDQGRNSIIEPNIEDLCEFLGNTRAVEAIEASYQPDITPLSPELTLERKRMLQQVRRDWATYREQDSETYDDPTWITSAEQRLGAIEMMLSDKHIRLWSRFLDSSCDFLLCFEDDAIFLHSSEQRLADVLKRASADGAGANLYADLAGGFGLPSLGLERLFDRKEKDFVYFKKPVTNTTCSYLLNRPMVRDFAEILAYQPALRCLPADWLINKLLVEIERLGRRTVCFHMEPTVFEHGTAKGVWPSTIK